MQLHAHVLQLFHYRNTLMFMFLGQHKTNTCIEAPRECKALSSHLTNSQTESRSEFPRTASAHPSDSFLIMAFQRVANPFITLFLSSVTYNAKRRCCSVGRHACS